MKAVALAYTTENEARPQTEKFAQPAHVGESQISPEVLVDTHFRIRSANRAFCEQFRLAPSVSNGIWLFSMGTGQWDNVAIRTMLNDAVASDTLQECTVPMDVPGAGRCLVHMTAQRRQNSRPMELIAVRVVECTLIRRSPEPLAPALTMNSDEISLSRSTQITLRGLCRELALIIGCAQAILDQGNMEQQENAEDIIAAAHLIQNAHSALMAQARDVTSPNPEALKDSVMARPQLRIDEADVLPPAGFALGVTKNRPSEQLVYA